MSPLVGLLAVIAALAAAELPAQATSLFGRRASALETEPARPSQPQGQGKADAEPDDPFAPKPEVPEAAKPKPAEPDDPFDAGGAGDAATPKPKPEADVGVRIRPVEVRALSPDGWARESVDFRISSIGHPLAKVETPARFAAAWQAFRQQHRRAGEGFERLPTRPEAVRCRLLQDLGEGRWLVGDTRVELPATASEPARAAAPGFQAVLVLADGRGKVGEAVAVAALRVGTFDLRFDCEVPPAAGRRITLRRIGYVESPVLPDDEPTREAFRKAVASGAALAAVFPVERDCRACNGLGYLRRRVPGKIQDARDPCATCGSDGKVTPDVEHRFRP